MCIIICIFWLHSHGNLLYLEYLFFSSMPRFTSFSSGQEYRLLSYLPMQLTFSYFIIDVLMNEASFIYLRLIFQSYCPFQQFNSLILKSSNLIDSIAGLIRHFILSNDQLSLFFQLINHLLFFTYLAKL